MKQILLVAGAGALGALSRWGLTAVCREVFGATFPFGTLAANVIGCLILGFVAQLSLQGPLIPEALRIPVTVGFLGALTAFFCWIYCSPMVFVIFEWRSMSSPGSDHEFHDPLCPAHGFDGFR